jgi:hypothetical protein
VLHRWWWEAGWTVAVWLVLWREGCRYHHRHCCAPCSVRFFLPHQ